MMGKMSLAAQILFFLLPWSLRRRALNATFGWSIDPTARIGYSILIVQKVTMGPGSRIGHLTVARYLSELSLGRNARLGNQNWIFAYPLALRHSFYDADDRRTRLIIGEESAITAAHRIDCTDEIDIGAFSTIGGWNSQILTHSIDIRDARQRCAPIRVGSHCFVGTRCILTKGAVLPDYCVLSAGSVLSGKLEETYRIYSGVPAVISREINPDSNYFFRKAGLCQ